MTSKNSASGMQETLLAAGSGTTVARRGADVAVNRERARRRRLWTITAVLALPTAFFWYRLVDDRPFNVFALPDIHIQWLYVVPILFFVMLGGLLVAMHFGTGRSPHTVFRPEQIDVRMNDVVGIDVVKSEVIRSLNLFLAHQVFADQMGGRPRRGVLFEGPPGTGKTHTAKALAAEAGVPFLFATATSFQSSWQGATQRKIRSYFKALRKIARKEGGAIGFIDEFDAIAATRSGMAMTAAMTAAPATAGLPVSACCGGLAGLDGALMTAAVSPALENRPFAGGGDLQTAVNEFLVQMQSFDEPTGGQRFVGKIVDAINLLLPPNRGLAKRAPKRSNVMLVASTNRATALDPALLRPGRFDQKLTFQLPDKAGRRQIVDHFLSRKAHDPGLNGERRDALAAVTQGYSPAMIEGLLDGGLVHAVQGGRTAMSWDDVEHARLDMEVGLGQPVGYTDHEMRLIATHESGHATAAFLVAPQRRLEVLTIIKRGSALGLLAHGDREDVYTRSRSEMIGLIQVALAGQCAEEIFFDDVSTGPGGDLMYATNIAAQMVGAVGMGDSLVSYAAVQGSAFSDTNIVGRVLGDTAGRAAVETLLQEQKRKIRALLLENVHLVEALRDALLDRNELIGSEITGVLEAAQERAEPAPSRQLVIDLTDAASGSERASQRAPLGGEQSSF